MTHSIIFSACIGLLLTHKLRQIRQKLPIKCFDLRLIFCRAWRMDRRLDRRLGTGRWCACGRGARQDFDNLASQIQLLVICLYRHPHQKTAAVRI